MLLSLLLACAQPAGAGPQAPESAPSAIPEAARAALAPWCEGGCGGAVTLFVDAGGVARLFRYDHDLDRCSHGVTAWIDPAGALVHRSSDKPATEESLASSRAALDPLLVGLERGQRVACADVLAPRR